MKRLPALAMFASMCWAGESLRPECTKASQGRFWPEVANSSREVARQLYRSGELQMCSLTPSKYRASWKYKWQFVSVNVRDLAKRRRSESGKAGSESR